MSEDRRILDTPSSELARRSKSDAGEGAGVAPLADLPAESTAPTHDGRMLPRQVFLSHIAEESSRAKDLKELLEQAFDYRVRVFVSSTAEDLKPGDRWLEAMLRQLKTADVILVLCSRASSRRAWVNFESGSGWRADIPVIPVCHKGLDLHRLPPPLSMFQALALTQSDAIVVLLRRLSECLRLPIGGAQLVDARDRHLEMRAQDSSDEETLSLLAELQQLPPSPVLDTLRKSLEMRVRRKWGFRGTFNG